MFVEQSANAEEQMNVQESIIRTVERMHESDYNNGSILNTLDTRISPSVDSSSDETFQKKRIVTSDSEVNVDRNSAALKSQSNSENNFSNDEEQYNEKSGSVYSSYQELYYKDTDNISDATSLTEQVLLQAKIEQDPAVIFNKAFVTQFNLPSSKQSDALLEHYASDSGVPVQSVPKTTVTSEITEKVINKPVRTILGH